MKAKLKVKGIHCKSCEVLIKDALDDIGVDVIVDVKTGDVTVSFDETKTALSKIKKAIREEGYEV